MTTPDRPPVSPDTDLAAEVAALAELLAEIVELAEHRGAVFPAASR